MGRRREPRVVVSIPVRVSGIDYDGNLFTQTAQTVDVSRTGARLSGVRCLRAPGEMVTIECGPNSGRFVVVWIGLPGSDEDGAFGVKALQPEKRIFHVDMGEPRADEYMAPSEPVTVDPFLAPPVSAEQWDHSERRAARRIRCAGTGQIRQRGVAFPIWAKLADISSGGCYVEMVFTIPRGSEVAIQLTINSRDLAAKGKVVTSHPGVGVGIKFTELTAENRLILSEILQELTKANPQRTRSGSQTYPAP
ncbi:MAG TPA: PilZ domain-containing protein [Terriglobales bacterium]|nr:PilZ domain-containing protein [Terriglobales bacterium]